MWSNSDRDWTTMFVDPTTNQTYNFAFKSPYLGSYTNVFQLDLEKHNSWCQHLPHPMPFFIPLMFTPNEFGRKTQIPAFDSTPDGLYTLSQMQNFWPSIFHASASDTVLKKFTRTVLTQSKSIRISDPGSLEHFLTPSSPLDVLDATSCRQIKMNFFGTGKTYSVFRKLFPLFLFCIIVTVIGFPELEIRKTSGASFGFVKTKIGPTFNVFLLQLQTLLYDSEDKKFCQSSHPECKR